MSFHAVTFWGQSLGKQASLYVTIPEGKGPFPVLYLLHGLSDDHTIWLRRTSIERYADAAGVMAVMPDGGRSFYANDPRPAGLAYEDHIAQDVVGYVDRTFPTIAKRTSRAISGLSMGGYGSMMLALRHPDIFGAVSAHSAAFGASHASSGNPDLDRLVAHLPRERYDCYLLAKRLLAASTRKAPAGRKAARAPLPAIRFDCGTEDFLLASNRGFHAHLSKLGFAHEYQEFPGTHDWAYWDLHVQQTLEFVLKHVKKK